MRHFHDVLPYVPFSFILYWNKVSQNGTCFSLFIFYKMLFYFRKELYSILLFRRRATKGVQNRTFHDHKTHKIITLPLLYVHFIISGTFLIDRCEPLYPKCKVKIHTTENNHNVFFFFQLLKFSPLSIRIELILADIVEAEVVTESRTKQNNKLTINNHVTKQEYSINKSIHDIIKQFT